MAKNMIIDGIFQDVEMMEMRHAMNTWTGVEIATVTIGEAASTGQRSHVSVDSLTNGRS